MLDDLEQINRAVTEGDKRLTVWLYWRENPYFPAASCTRYSDDDDVWEDYVGMMDVDTTEDLEPDRWADGTPKRVAYRAPMSTERS